MLINFDIVIFMGYLIGRMVIPVKGYDIYKLFFGYRCLPSLVCNHAECSIEGNRSAGISLPTEPFSFKERRWFDIALKRCVIF